MTRPSLLNTPGSREASSDRCAGEEVEDGDEGDVGDEDGRLASCSRKRREAARISGAGWLSAHCSERKTA